VYNHAELHWTPTRLAHGVRAQGLSSVPGRTFHQRWCGVNIAREGSSEPLVRICCRRILVKVKLPVKVFYSNNIIFKFASKDQKRSSQDGWPDQAKSALPETDH